MREKQKNLIPRVYSQEELAKHSEASGDFFTHYSNRIRIAASEVEFRFFIGEVYPTAKGTPRVVEDFCVVVPPQVALAVSTLLASTIEKYEKQWGPIKKADEAPIHMQLDDPRKV